MSLQREYFGDPLLRSIYYKIEFISKRFEQSQIAKRNEVEDLLNHTPIELVEYLFNYLKNQGE